VTKEFKIRRAVNGYIASYDGKEYVYDNYLELVITLGEALDEKAAVLIFDEAKKRQDAEEAGEGEK
jgi:hypothetical protein